MAYKFTGVVNIKWIEATRLVGLQYKPSEIELGWPMAMEPCRIACLQYPYPQYNGSLEETKKQAMGQTYIHTALRAGCKSGDIPHIEYDRVNYCTKPNGEFDGIDQWRELAIEAKDFIEWLDARLEKPSEYIEAWYQANKMEILQPTAPATTPSPLAPKSTTKPVRDALGPLIKLAVQECQTEQKSTATASVMHKLQTWASEQPPRWPLVGVTVGGVKWKNGNEDLSELTIKLLGKRLTRIVSIPPRPAETRKLDSSHQTRPNRCIPTKGLHPMPANTPAFDQLPDSAFIRERHLVANPKRPGAPALLPYSANTLWRKVKSGDFPAPVKLSAHVTAWQVGAVRQYLAQQAQTAGAGAAVQGAQ